MTAPSPEALRDVRVVEFTGGMAGPWIGRFMAYCGAEVIRVESRHHPGVVRLYVPPWAPEQGIQPDLSPWFTDWDAGKHFVSLDLRRPEGVELAKRLVARADIVVENYSTGVMEKLGLGPDALCAANPRLISFSSNGFGHAGPHCRHVTWGPNIEAVAGIATLSGFPERDCAITQYAYPDSLGALHGLFAILCALEHRDRTGEAQHISLSQLEATVGVVGHVLMESLAGQGPPERLGNASLTHAPHGCYPCAGDDRWCVIAVTSDAEWQRLCDALDRPGWRRDPRFVDREARRAHRVELDAEIAAWTAERDPYEVMETLQAVGVPAGVVQDTEDQFQRDSHLRARGYFEEIDHLRKGTVVANGIPLGLTGTPGRTWRAGGVMGEDNGYVFGELLGLGEEEMARYVAAGAIEEPGDQAERPGPPDSSSS